MRYLPILNIIRNKKDLVLPCLVMIALVSVAQAQQKPNVLFVISDDLTTTAISSYGNTAVSTPNIDRLAGDGTKYTRAYTQYPICGPSRASFMFGYYPSATGTYGYVSGRKEVGPGRKSWSQLFKDNGYFTARVGKIFHMGTLDLINGSNGTDDEASWTERYNSQDPLWNAEGEGELVQKNPYGLEPPKQGTNLMSIIKAEGTDSDYSDGKTADKISELLKRHKNRPFFIAAGLFRPHVPFVAPKTYFNAYPYNQVVLPPKVVNDWDDIPVPGINYVTSVNALMSQEQEKKAIAAYYANVSYMDTQLGKILKTLKDEGLEKNTIVIFTSDHGYHLGEHNFWMKVGLHEESVRVPLIIKVPGKQPRVCHSLVELIDLYPTISELAGLKVSPHLQGLSIVKTLDNPSHKVRDVAFSVSDNLNQKGKAFLVRTEKWSYMQYGEAAEDGMELYDMDIDSKQFNNLAYLPKYLTTVKQMQQELKHKLQTVRKNDLANN